MSVSNQSLLIVAVYGALFMAATVGIHTWQIKRRKQKPPVEFKLRRAPGESLRRKMAKFDEDMAQNLIWAMVTPIVAGLIVSGIFLKFFPPASERALMIGYAATAVVFIGTLIVSIRWCLQGLRRYRNDRLGYLGERAVGEALEPLSAQGYRVFHDVPLTAGGFDFNVDHVAVGPNGVFAIETKTRRKGRARPGFEAHKVIYDGRQLVWPWTEDSFGLQQAESRAKCLAEWLVKMTGMTIAAKPMLVLPGWYIVVKGFGAVTVLNHKQIETAITRGATHSLTSEQIDLIARQLDNLCRDVED